MAASKTLVFKVKHSQPQLVVAEKPTPDEIKQLSDIDDQEVGGRLDPIKIIRDGLAKALVYYYPFAARIFEGPNRKLMVNLPWRDCWMPIFVYSGVMFVKADANVKLQQFGDGILQPCSYMDEVMCRMPDSPGIIGCPLLFFFRRFLYGGFSLGDQLNHTMADAYGIMLFLNAVRVRFEGTSTPSIPPVAIQSMIVLASVFFGPKETQALRNQLPTNETPSLTRFELITACLWKCRTIALEPNPNDITRISIVMNVRQKEEIGLPTGYYDNGIVYPAATLKAGVLCESPLTYDLDLVQWAKTQVNKKYVKSLADFMVIKGRPNYVTALNYMVFDITNFGFDKLDLEWGKPLFGGVSCATPVITIYSSLKNDKGGKWIFDTRNVCHL
ncbi:benzyl alcohol O-benzoyltransferase [Handroanthus impetiginosus]|uniref:Benzyl alcohol O-benzoyltransferase n=1 Tax=Handroanthus impetiginosus TaxID=429701 RepID=A0A2G9HPC0_9LAMI|nr:benzyl alcohol O-benzoyltransferase [Handroanthus impetiginosus]